MVPIVHRSLSCSSFSTSNESTHGALQHSMSFRAALAGELIPSPSSSSSSSSSSSRVTRKFHVRAVLETTRKPETRRASPPPEDGKSAKSTNKSSINGYTRENPSKNRPNGSASNVHGHPGTSTSNQPMFNPVEDALRAAATSLCDTVESFIAAYIDPREYPPSQDPKIQLAVNFSPVAEFPPQRCTHVGNIPECLHGGAYIRNGSNPLHSPPAGYHYFDGHGMLHAVKFSDKDGSPTYCARFTKTNRFLHDQAAGKSLFPNALGGMGLARLGLFAMRTALGLIDILGGSGTSNAGMAYFDGRILAMSEDDVPYAVRITEAGDVETVGRYSFNKDLFMPMCAHPKIDPVTGELFAFCSNPVINPHLRYFWASPDGKKSPDFPIWLPEPCLFHDFTVTEHYAIFPENQLVFKMENLFLQGQPPITGDSSKVPRFGVIPRYPTSDSRMKWFDVPDWTSFHYLNSWEEGDEIVVLGSSISPVECLFDDMAGLSNRLTEIHLNMRTGRSYKQHVCSAGLDFGQLNERFSGRKNRFVYMCYYGPWPKLSGLAKVDLDAPRLPRLIENPSDPDLNEPCIVASRRFGAGRFCSEPFFVARNEEAGAEEDDGYVLSYVHDENTGASELLVMDARSPTLETVASIRLPARVPYGFHGIFVNASEVANQSLAPL